MTGGQVLGDPEMVIQGIAPFDAAGEGDITFVDNRKYLKRLDDSDAGAVFTAEEVKDTTKTIIRVKNPKLAFSVILNKFHPPKIPAKGIHDRAEIGSGFSCGRDVSVSAMVTIGDNVRIGDHVVLHPGVVIGDDVVIGHDTICHPNVTILERCEVGNRVIIHSGSVIGSDGYGFVPDGETYHKIPQTGIVRIDDDVEIGAGNTIDRATFGQTWIKQGVKTDNLVHVAHNVTVGKNTVIVAQTGIAGSTKIGDHVAISGQVAVVGHIHIGNNVSIAGKAGVTKSVSDGQIVSGNPAMPHRTWLRVQNIIPRLPELKKKIVDIEKRLKDLETGE